MYFKKMLSVFNRLKSIPHEDEELNDETWFTKQPCAKLSIASKEIIITQPLSTFWVYLLGVLTVIVGLYFFAIQEGEQSRLWWGISLLLWGIGALLAGTSYQAFGYTIKCKGREKCAWTSWWEVIYLMFQQVSINALLVAVAYSCTTGILQEVLLWYALISSVGYIILTFIGGIVPIKSLITFELMVWISTPAFVFLSALNAWRYFAYGYTMDILLLGCWIILLGSMIAYWMYYKKGITDKLWKKGVWFSENDVLHVTLIIWIIYIAAVLPKHITDYNMIF